MNNYMERQKAHHSSYLTRNRYVIRIKKPSLKLHVKYRSYQNIQNVLRGITQFVSSYGYLLCAMLWCVVIFLFSNQPATVSSRQSLHAYEMFGNIGFLRALFAVIPIRKCAHMFLYAILGILLFLFFRWRTNHPHITALVYCYLYAGLDEFHQIFVPSRGAALTDTFIDLAGAIIGVLAISMICFCVYVCRKRTNCKSISFEA